jgi:YfiH family protein
VPKQIHSEIVVLWEKIKDTTEADAVVFSNIGVSGVKTADCIPIFLYDPDLKIASVIHAGWQGLAKGIIENTLLKIKEKGGNPERILVAIGPHIGFCCYSVAKERIEEFVKLGFPKDTISREKDGKFFLNLEVIAKTFLIVSGVLIENIDCIEKCTFTQENLWSLRREGALPKLRPVNNIIGFYEK